MSKPARAELDEYAAGNKKLAAFRRAQADLYDNTALEAAAGITEETDEFTRLNQAVIDTGKQLPKGLRHLRKDI